MRHTFLHYVAKDLYNRIQSNDMSRTAVIFPNKRASLFLNEELITIANEQGCGTIWSPACLTISELFRANSQYITTESNSQLSLIYRLYRIFVKHVGARETSASSTATTESFDHFYGWGQMLLADFDDIDKNMGPAEKIFSNLANIREIEDITDYLNERQLKAIETYFGTDLKENYRLRQKFEAVWSQLGSIYQEFRKELSDEEKNPTREVYEGMLYREVSERINTLDFERYDRYAFVGFNMIQQCEEVLFSRIQEIGKSLFYWDYDHHYTDKKEGRDMEAGHYVRKWLEKYPNALPNDSEEIYDQWSNEKSIRFVSATSEDIQARYVRQWMQMSHERKDRNSAVVLCDEKLLPNVLDALPGTHESPTEINITMGYPFRLTPIAIRLFSASSTYLNNPSEKRDLDGLTRTLTETLEKSAEEWEGKDVLTKESLYQASLLIREMNTALSPIEKEGEITPTMLHRFFNQLLNSVAIPFHGEPAKGIQIMGVLETRNLDFKELLLLSCNEGNMPKGVSDSSFIPYDIRKAYSLTTVDNKVAIYAYYFYSLLQRADDITICYNTATEGTSTGEMSRFMRQMMVEMPGVHIQMDSLSYGHESEKKTDQTSHPTGDIQKTPKMIEYLLKNRTEEGSKNGLSAQEKAFFSPSALNLYIDCPARFYFRYIAHLEEPEDENSLQDIDGALFGTLFHDACEYLYTDLNGMGVDLDQLEEEKKRTLMESKADKALSCSLQKNLLKKLEPDTGMQARDVPLSTGSQIICREVLSLLLHRLVKIDASIQSLQIIAMEKDVSMPLKIHVGGKKYTTSVGGRIDRIDTTDGGMSLRVVDYKTGKEKHKGPKITDPTKQLTDGTFEGDQRAYWFQTFLYSHIVRNDQHLNPSGVAVRPALLYILSPKASNPKTYNPVLETASGPITDINDVTNGFIEKVHQLVSEIFDINHPFTRTENTKNCSYCPFGPMCRKYQNESEEEESEE